MAIAAVLEFPGGTLDQYDQVIERMGFQHEGAGAPGALFHWATQTENAVLVTDVWADRETFDRFAEERIGPITAEVGIPGPPRITFYEVHNYLTAG